MEKNSEKRLECDDTLYTVYDFYMSRTQEDEDKKWDGEKLEFLMHDEMGCMPQSFPPIGTHMNLPKFSNVTIITEDELSETIEKIVSEKLRKLQREWELNPFQMGNPSCVTNCPITDYFGHTNVTLP